MNTLFKKIITMILIIATIFTGLLTVYADNDTSESETLLEYRSRKISYYQTSYYPGSDGWICYDSEPNKVLLYEFKNLSSDQVYYYKNQYSDGNYTVESEKFTNIGYGYSETPDGYIFYRPYQLSRAYGETGKNGEPLYYDSFYGNVYYRGTTNGLYDIYIYTHTKYYYYSYGEWSAWSSTPRVASKDLDVETRTLYKKNITFELNGGEGILSERVFQYHTLSKPENPTKNGFAFVGWYKEPELITEWNFDTDTVDADITLYAKWGFDKNIIFFEKDSIETNRNKTITVTPKFAVNDTNKAIVAKYKFDNSVLTYSGIQANEYKYVSTKIVNIDSQYSYLQVTAQYDTAGCLNSGEFIIPYYINFTVNNSADYKSSQIEVYDINNAYALNNNSSKVTFEVCYPSTITIVQSKVNELEILGDNTINLPKKYTVSVMPEDADNSVSWSVDDEAIAQITPDGILKPKANGTLTLTATSTDGSNISSTKQITVDGLISYLDNIVFSSNCSSEDFAYSNFNYRVKVEENADVVTFTPTFGDGLLICDDEFLFSGMEKSIDMSNASVTVSMQLSMGNAIESTYTIEFYKEVAPYNLICENLVVSNDNISFDISAVLPDDSNGTIIIAWYNATSMIDSESYSPSSPINFSIGTSGIKYIKILCWNMDTLYPLTDYLKIDLND